MDNETIQIRVSDLVHAVMKRRILILVLTIIGLAVGILLSVVSYMRGEMSKEYAVTTSFAVVSTTQDGLFTTKTSNPGSTDIYLAENMVDSVIYVMKSDRTLSAAIDRLDLIGISANDIARNLTLRQYNATQIVEMTLLWRSAEEGVQIMSAINAVAPSILISTLKIGGVSVVNNPTARYLIGGNLNMSVWIYTMVLGFMVGVGIAVIGVLLQPTLVNTKDVEMLLGLDLMGEIPYNKKYFSKRRNLLTDPSDAQEHAIRNRFATTAHILHHKLGHDAHQLIYVTSASANEGKTAVAANVAVMLSEMEHRVLLIDFDTVNPSLATLFVERVEYRCSLNAVYRGDTAKEQALIHLTGYLDMMPTILEPRPLPMDDAMLSLITDMAKDYDYVIMDTPPVGRVANALNLNDIANAALLVIGYDNVPMNDVREAINHLEKSGMRILGAIVNGVNKTSSGYYGYYYGSSSIRNGSGDSENRFHKPSENADSSEPVNQ